MSGRRGDLTQTLEAMRRSFDAGFAQPPAAQAAETKDFLAIRVGPGRYALPIAELAGLERHRRIVPLPAEDPALLGIAGIQGRLVPVWSLAHLLGYGQAQEEESWIALCGRDAPVGLAFSGLDSYVRAPESDLCAADGAQAMGRIVREALRQESGVRYVLDVTAIVADRRESSAGGEKAGR